MPSRPHRPCSHPGCYALVNGRDSKCAKHLQTARRETDSKRPNSADRGYGAQWRIARAQFLRSHPLCMCADCKAAGLIVAASVVDHITPHRGDMRLFWDRENWQSLSKICHDRKTAREDGVFGRERINTAKRDTDRT